MAPPKKKHPVDPITLQPIPPDSLGWPLHTDNHSAFERAMRMERMRGHVTHTLSPYDKTATQILQERAWLSPEATAECLQHILDSEFHTLSAETHKLFYAWFTKTHGRITGNTLLKVVKLDNEKRYIIHVFSERPSQEPFVTGQAGIFNNAPARDVYPTRSYLIPLDITRKINLELKVQEYR